jgi:2-methylcitrate dehydratase PrpD
MTRANSISDELSGFVAGAKFETLPPATIQMVKRCLLDALGVTLAGGKLGDGCGAFIALACELDGVQESTIIGFDRRVPALMAAFANGSMAHAVDFEDTHEGAIVHPNAATIPAALAVAEARGEVDGKKLITAVAIGCDVVCRLGLALSESIDEFGWYTPPILGAFGATAAAGYLYGLDTHQMRDAYSLVLCQDVCSAEIKYSPDSVIRAVRDAFSAKTGVLSAQLAARCVTGFDHPFEGKAGFFTMFARGNYDPDILLADLGSRFEIDRISFKPWPTCRGTHLYIEAALELAREHRLDVDDIRHIHTTGNRLLRMLVEPEDQKKRPATAIDAKFSIPFSVASALCHGTVALEDFSPAALADEHVLELANKVSFSESGAVGNVAEDLIQGSMTIETSAGESLSMQLDQPYGHPERPVDDDFLIAKFKQCAAHSFIGADDARLQEIVDRVLSLEDIGDIGSGLMPLLRGDPG